MVIQTKSKTAETEQVVAPTMEVASKNKKA